MTPIRHYDFGPRSAEGPSVYLQAQLHGNEVQGQVALCSLVERLEALPSRAFLAAVRIVPVANPHAAHQYLHACNGMYDVETGLNWNRIFDWRDPALLEDVERYRPDASAQRPVSFHLKCSLLALSLGYATIVDVHTPEYGCEHLYCPRWTPGLPTFGVANIVEYDDFTLPSFDQAVVMLARACSPSRAVTSVTLEIDSTAALSPALVADWTARLTDGLVQIGALDARYAAAARVCEPGVCPELRRGVMRDHIAPASGPFVAIAPLGARAESGQALLEIESYEPGERPSVVIADSACVPLCLRRATVAVRGRWAVRVLAERDCDTTTAAVV